jgi:lipoyl(octanoyl) transferase
MSSAVSRSSGIDISGARSSQRFLDFARNDKSKQRLRGFFTQLTVYYDAIPRSAAMNMAVDEALLECAMVPTIRFYRWPSPALSFGYFGRFADVASYQRERDLVRRWTGGGIVFHGTDLTYSIVIPARDAAFGASSMSIYEKIHRALVRALKENGQSVIVATGADRGEVTGGSDAGYSCFENPVRADVMINGRKVAGAAQRRTRRGLLQQGSIQGIELGNDLTERFTEALSANRRERELDDEILNRARELAEQKYGTDAWLRKR